MPLQASARGPSRRAGQVPRGGPATFWRGANSLTPKRAQRKSDPEPDPLTHSIHMRASADQAPETHVLPTTSMATANHGPAVSGAYLLPDPDLQWRSTPAP